MALNISLADNNHRRNAAIRAFGVLPDSISLGPYTKDRERRAPPSFILARLQFLSVLIFPFLGSLLPGQIRLACESRDRFLRCASATRRKEVRETDSGTRSSLDLRTEGGGVTPDISRHLIAISFSSPSTRFSFQRNIDLDLLRYIARVHGKPRNDDYLQFHASFVPFFSRTMIPPSSMRSPKSDESRRKVSLSAVRCETPTSRGGAAGYTFPSRWKEGDALREAMTMTMTLAEKER